ncbi:hypothetical protein EYC59_01925 [Candidatus Saccharibacteria bacterium]|nr:MAG: hypothetical protein EYC59_01925 [Candidatus Saccharibacteria bacterium]
MTELTTQQIAREPDGYVEPQSFEVLPGMIPVTGWKSDEWREVFAEASDKFGGALDQLWSAVPTYLMRREGKIMSASVSKRQVIFYETPLTNEDQELVTALHFGRYDFDDYKERIAQLSGDHTSTAITENNPDDALFTPAEQLYMTLENLTERLNTEGSIRVKNTPHHIRFRDILYQPVGQPNPYQSLIPTFMKYLKHIEREERKEMTPAFAGQPEDILLIMTLKLREYERLRPRQLPERRYKYATINPADLLSDIMQLSADYVMNDILWDGDDSQPGLRTVAANIAETQAHSGELADEDYVQRMNIHILEALKLKYWAEKLAKRRLRLGGSGINFASSHEYGRKQAELLEYR